jgi:hypothetical protein
LIVLLLQSCAGYKRVGLDNIFKKNDIKSVVIHQTENDSSYYNVSHYFSQSIIKELAGLKGMIIKNSLDGNEGESVLSTRLISNYDKSKAVTVEAMKFIDKSTGYESSIGSRKGFYINYQLGYLLELEVVLIKNPKRSENTSLSDSKVIFKKVFPLSFKLNNVSQAGSGPDGLGAVNFVMNESLKEKAFELASNKLAIEVRRHFED